MRGLIYKELLAARAYLLVGALYGALEILSHLLRTDLSGGFAQVLSPEFDAGLLVCGLLVFAMGHGQVAPEIQRGHIELLDGLPVGRASIFCAKVLIGSWVIIGLLGTRAFIDVSFTRLAFGAASLETSLLVALAHAAGLLAFYGAGLVLSWFGGFGWVLLGLASMMVFTLVESQEELRPLSLMHGYARVYFEDGSAVVRLWPAKAWAIFGVVGSVSSGLLFLGPGDQLVRRGSQVVPRVKTVAVALLGGLLGLAVLGTSTTLLGRPGSSRSHVRVGRFDFLLPEAPSEAHRSVLENARDLDRKLARVFEVEATRERLAVELLGGGRYHAGVYTGGKVRMAADTNAVHTFAHELAHAYAHRLTSGVSLTRHMGALRFFNEGLAMWAAEQVLPTSVQSGDAFRQWAAAIRRAGHHHLDALMDDERRREAWDAFEAYPLGLVFVEALVDTAGPEVVPCLLREVAHLPPQPLVGATIWSRLMKGCSVAESRVVQAYEARLDRYVARFDSSRWLYTGAVVRDGGQDYVVVEPAPEGRVQTCRFRSRVSSAPADLSEVGVDAQGRCPVLTEDGSTGTIWFQVGVELSLGWSVFGPWVAQPTPRG